MKNYLKNLFTFAFLFFNMQMFGQVYTGGHTWIDHELGLIQHPIGWDEVWGGFPCDYCGGGNNPNASGVIRTIMTYNLHKDVDTTYAANGKLIKSTGADVVAIQEINRFAWLTNFQDLKNNAEMNGKFLRTMHMVVGRYGIAILYKSSLGSPSIVKKRVDTSSSDTDGTRGYIIAQFSNFTVVSTHLATGSGGDKEMMIDAILNESKVKNGDKPVFIAGDMNFAPTNSALRTLFSNKFFYLLNNEAKDPADNSKYLDATRPSGEMIDLIFANRAWKYRLIGRGIPAGAHVPNSFSYSDHLPYFVKVKLLGYFP